MSETGARLLSSPAAETKLRPLHLGVFYVDALHHRVIVSDDEWRESMNSLFDMLARGALPYRRHFEREIAGLEYGGYCLGINRWSAVFAITSGPGKDDDWDELPCGYAHRFKTEAKRFAGDIPEAAAHLVSIAENILGRLEREVSFAIERGDIEVYARPESALAGYQRIEPAQWKWFFPEYEIFGPSMKAAVSPFGDLVLDPVFSIVTEAREPLTAVARRCACTEALTEIVLSKPSQPMTREEIYVWARREYGVDFTKVEIDACRANAIRAAQPNTWAAPGRRRKQAG